MQYDSQLFSELYDVQPQAIVWLKPIWGDEDTITDFEFTYCNEEGLKYLNITREQQKGLRVSNSPTISDSLRPKFMQDLIRVYKTGEKAETSVFNPALNKYAHVLRTKLRDGVLNVVQDRTEENRIIKKLEEQTKQLKEQKRLLDNLLYFSPAGISVTEVIRDEEGNVADGRTILSNDLGYTYAGISKEESMNKTIGEMDPAMLKGPLFQKMINTLATGEPFHTQYYFEPTERWLELSVAKMDDDRLINVFMDITHIKEAQSRQQTLLEELQRSNANLEEFAYAASHDLKEPIRKINFFSDRLKQHLAKQPNSEEMVLLMRMENAAQRMGLLVDDLLEYSHISRGIDKLEPVNLNEKLRLVQEDLELTIQEKKAVIQVGALPMVKGHRRQLQQLFQNLISNALKYSKADVAPMVLISSQSISGKEADIHVPGTHKDNLFHLIEVADNGIGFAQEDAERIFKVFTRLHGKSEYSGTGVGLSIAQKVVENHRGYIWAESTPGKGATFKVLLPAE